MDEKERYRPTVVDFAWDVIRMHGRIEALEAEVARLREFETKYRDLVDENIRHSQIMARNMLDLALMNNKIPMKEEG